MDVHAEAPHVVIIGGFLTEPLFFEPMRQRLLRRGAARVTIAPVHLPDWLALGFAGMGPVMLRGALAIRRARRRAPAPLIVVGHSAGGIVARLAMLPVPFDGRSAGVAEDVGCLVTLGTPYRFDPHIPGWRHAGVRATEFLDWVTPGAWYAPRTTYLSVGSRLVPPSPLRPSLSPDRLGHLITRVAVGQTPGVHGDGLVDEQRAHLPGAQHLTFGDVLHGTFGGPWYGDDHVVDRWWPVALEAWREALGARAQQPSHAPVSRAAAPPRAPRPATALPSRA
jgi:hypothetical protein